MVQLLFILIALFASVILIPFVQGNRKGIIAIICIVLNAILSSTLAISVFNHGSQALMLNGGQVFGEIPVRIDALSGWFLLIMNFTSVTAVLYGNQYLKAYSKETSRLSLHFISFVLNHAAMIGIYIFQNSLLFLCVWEMMAVTAFIMVIFESQKMETLKAGINYLIQSHISIVFLLLGFLWIYIKTGSFDFNSIAQYTATINPAFSFFLFFMLFIGFGIKAGFVPFHTWLPYAHPAAPSHVSGLMSGVLIKLGIYGILRMLLLVKVDYLLVGSIILLLSVITGIYGVMLAILQHNLKKLLAYHSIENIGIIGIGIGLGAIGKGLNNSFLEFAGFAGALMHTLNHSLFKSLLFYTAGTVYQATHIIHIEKLGGLIKKLPHTGLLFLLASVAICGLPPFNGFISEFLIYSGLFNAIHHGHLSQMVMIILSIFGLVLIGGLALFCFTKAFGIAFLGSARTTYPEDMHEGGKAKLFPKYLAASLILAIGLFPQYFLQAVAAPVSLFSEGNEGFLQSASLISTMQKVSLASWSLILISLAVYYTKKYVSKRGVVSVAPTWGCAYETASPRLQYTSSSFSRSYKNLVKPLIKVYKHEDKISSVVPLKVNVESHVYDKIEMTVIDIPLRKLKGFIGRFKFLQNGSVQFYVLYGVVFIFIAITIPFLIHTTKFLIEIFKQL
jgi:hydrogenase-4 component B